MENKQRLYLEDMTSRRQGYFIVSYMQNYQIFHLYKEKYELALDYGYLRFCAQLRIF